MVILRRSESGEEKRENDILCMCEPRILCDDRVLETLQKIIEKTNCNYINIIILCIHNICIINILKDKSIERGLRITQIDSVADNASHHYKVGTTAP